MDVSDIVFKKLFIRGKSLNTIDAYEYQITRFLTWVDKPRLKVNQSDIEDYIVYMRKKGFAHSTINLAIASLKFFFVDFMNRRFRIKALRKQEKHTGVVDHDIIMKSISVMKNKKHRLLLSLLYGSGLRVGEAVKIRHEDILSDEIIIRQGKGARDRKAVLSQKFIEEYSNLEKKKGFVFEGRTGHLTISSAQEIVKKAFKNKHVHPHMLRASFATHLHESKVDINDIQRLLGHKDVRTTTIYTKYTKLNPNKIISPIDNQYH